MGRNTGLFSAFVVYMDLLRPYLGDSPFVYGATCSNLAWLTVWPFDVVKTQRQSGRHPGVSALALLSNAARDGALFRGLLPQQRRREPKQRQYARERLRLLRRERWLGGPHVGARGTSVHSPVY